MDARESILATGRLEPAEVFGIQADGARRRSQRLGHLDGAGVLGERDRDPLLSLGELVGSQSLPRFSPNGLRIVWRGWGRMPRFPSPASGPGLRPQPHGTLLRAPPECEPLESHPCPAPPEHRVQGGVRIAERGPPEDAAPGRCARCTGGGPGGSRKGSGWWFEAIEGWGRKHRPRRAVVHGAREVLGQSLREADESTGPEPGIGIRKGSRA